MGMNDWYLDIFGQQGSFSSYIQVTLAYSLDNASELAVIEVLTKGLEHLTASFPWVSGYIANEGAINGKQTGVFKIVPLDEIPLLVVKDLRHDTSPDVLTMDALKQAGFPMSMLDEAVLAPSKTLTDEAEAGLKQPVFLLQANFLKGGLLLTFNGQHQAMDMIGLGWVMKLLAKACRNEPFTAEELTIGNLPRRHIYPLLNDEEYRLVNLDHQIVKPAQIFGAKPPLPPANSSWAYFRLSPSALAVLKSLAAKTITVPFISTDDAITTLIWQAVMRARLPRLDPAGEVKLGRAVDIRPFVGVPATYPGLAMNMTYHAYTLEKLIQEPLGKIASDLREALASDPTPAGLAFKSRALATLLDRSPDKSNIHIMAALNPSTDLLLSSWSKVDCFAFDHGFGMPEEVRRPRFTPFEGMMFLMPRKQDGEISAAICLRDEDMERLRTDAEFGKYAIYVG